MVDIRTHRLIDCDVEEGVDYLQSKASDRVAKDFFDDYRRTFKRIEENPFQFGEEADGIRHAAFDKFPYSILYEIRPSHVWLFAVSHHARQPGTYDRRR